MASKKYETIVKESIIMTREGGLTSSGQRRLLEKTAKGEELPIKLPIKIYITQADIDVLDSHGFRGVFKVGDNYVTKSDIVTLVGKFRKKGETIANDNRRRKLAKLINRLMATFGGAFVIEIGGYIDLPEKGAKVSAKPRLISARK
jgi:hypothetical protein